MKFFLLLISLFTINIANAQIVFLDINDNPKEKATAIKAARKAGKEIIVYPKDDSMFSPEKAFEILKQNPPETLLISGHDGGGSFGGDRGESFSYDELNTLVQQNPEVGKNLRVLGLLGCNTANHSEIVKWKRTFPNLAFVAGFDGTAPSETKRAALTYISDTILKSDKILKQTDGAKIKRLFENFRYINSLEATLYVDTCPKSDGPQGQYIFRPKRSQNERFKPFDTSECVAKRKEYHEEYEPLYQQYFSGDKEIPQKTAGTPLRKLYTFMRQNQHCFEVEQGQVPTADHLLRMVFYHNVQKNFNSYFEKELNRYFEELAIFSDEVALRKQLESKKKKLSKDLQRLEEYQNNFELYKKDRSKYLNNQLKDLQKENPKFSNFMKRALNASASERAGLMREFRRLQRDPKFMPFMMKYSLIHESLKASDEDLGASLLGAIDQTTNELDTIKGALIYHEDIKRMQDFYEELPAKNLAEFKRLSRKEVATFVHKANNLSHTFTKSTDFNRQITSGIERILYYVDDEMIPFNWHDATIQPKDPIGFNHEMLKEYEDNKSFEERYFQDY